MAKSKRETPREFGPAPCVPREDSFGGASFVARTATHIKWWLFRPSVHKPRLAVVAATSTLPPPLEAGVAATASVPNPWNSGVER